MRMPELKNSREEIEKLLSLLEQSTENIDKLKAKYTNQTITSYAAYVAVYVLMLPALYIYTSSSTLWQNHTLSIIIAIITLTLSIGVFLISYMLIRNSKATKNNIEIEHEIHDELIRIIDSHRHQLEESNGLSPIALAMIRIRLMRLYRQRNK
jgi:hypothetical protein